MKYLTVKQVAEKWNISERSVRNYCKNGRIMGAVIKGKHWIIPDDVEKPKRKIRAGKLPNTILERLKLEKESKMPGGIYHKIQIELTYNSNHIEGSRLTHDQTRHIYETNTIGVKDSVINVDDIVETANHFRCIDYIIDMVNYPISESMIKQLHSLLKAGTSDSRKAWFAVGDYKKLENEVGGIKTTKPKDVEKEMRNLLKKYNRKKSKSFEEIIEFHYMFERIHPFQDGNGRVGRLIMFKECLKNNIVPFIIDDSLKEFYYRGLKEWKNERGHLLDTCLTAQDRFKLIMDYFGLNYK
ncbi:DNA-binding protein [uncultured Eubacterium sp.]|jgi:fic family protein|uniref:Fic family protein n=1 Tax=uncultured Eubacterium sp. TaxID=165185 RepID=UPI00260E76BF|nr:DNA-binding protein [uncultured Eubacterium sp.]